MAKLTHHNEEHEAVSFEPIPLSQVAAEVNNTEVLPTKDGKGSYLKVTFEVLEPDYVGRMLWNNFTLENKSEDAVRIGRGQLTSLCQACGKTGISKDSSELHGSKLILGLKIVKDPEYGPQNKITSYKELKTKVSSPAKKEKTPTGFDGETDFDSDDIPF